MSTMRINGMNVDEFKEYLRDKKVIVVGNNISALTKEQGEFIDSHDIVIRFGKGIPVPEYHKYIGSKMDVWVTGMLRRANYHEIADPKPVVLFNNSLFRGKVKLPDYPVLPMYEQEEIVKIITQYEEYSDYRLSAGTLTSHWLVNVIGTYSSITFINFDFFTKVVNFSFGKPGEVRDKYASSWHLPITSDDYEGPNALQNPAHSPALEKAVFKDIVKMPNTKFIGVALAQPVLIEAPKYLPFKGTRRHK